MNLCLRESEIEYWAERYVECQKLSSRQSEQSLIECKNRIQKCEAMALEELYDISYWKSRCQSKRLWDNLKVDVNRITKEAFMSNNDWDKLKTLLTLEGISYAKASAILHLYDKGLYPIIDIYAVWSVDKNETIKNS